MSGESARLALNSDENAAVKAEPDGEGAGKSVGLQATQQLSSTQHAEGGTPTTAAEALKSSSTPTGAGKRAPNEESKPVPGAKKAKKSTPTATASQLQKAAAAKGQRTMASFFTKTD